jgi:glyoxylase-like metal-dependent hydrolase (beta-lactamase superfamily II)/ferredoxin
MAQLSQRRQENVAGDFYVDASCIDCDTCRWMAPTVFHRQGDQAAVHHQPHNDPKDPERQAALQALLACPTASIGTQEKPQDIKIAQGSFPLPIAENIFHCGYHSPRFYGAASYFIQRKAGNILIDSPRFTPLLVKQLEALGGIRYLYLTHRDDVADHQKFHDHFGCDRLLHQDDITDATAGIEMPLQGQDPIELAPDCLIIPVPGHTQGHTVLLYQNRFLFTGDHLAWSYHTGSLTAFRNYCWYSWPRQGESMQKLTQYAFEWILPGHGRRYHADPDTMQRELQKCLADF